MMQFYISACLSVLSILILKVSATGQSKHVDNWAVLVATSKFWYNYRHVGNVLYFYRTVKKLGIPDSHIILLLAGDVPCNPRNIFPGTVFNNNNRELNLYDDDIEVDYRGEEVSVESFIRLLIGLLPTNTPRSKQLLSNERSNILIYLDGHGGEGYIKFLDSHELTNHDLAFTFEQMWQKQRYNEIFLIIDSCHGASNYKYIYSPNIIAMASTLENESSYAIEQHSDLGVEIIDQFTYYVSEFFENVTRNSRKTLADFFQICPKDVCFSTVNVRQDLYRRDPHKVPILDFFGTYYKTKLTYNVSKINLQWNNAKPIIKKTLKFKYRFAKPLEI